MDLASSLIFSFGKKERKKPLIWHVCNGQINCHQTRMADTHVLYVFVAYIYCMRRPLNKLGLVDICLIVSARLVTRQTEGY